MLEGKLIVCDSNIPWHHNRYSKHHLMSQLARTNEVVFVDPEEELGAYRRRDRRQRESLLRRCYRPPGEDLTVFTPLQIPGRAQVKLLQRWDERYYVRQLKSVVRQHPGRDLILFAGNPWHVFLLDAFPEAACTVYHCSDNFPALFAGDFRRHFEEREEELIRRADLVVCSSPRLVEKCRRYSDRVHYLEHAVDERFLRPEGEMPCPEDLAQIPRPRAVFFGSLDRLVNYSLLEQLARDAADLSLVLIGPVSEDVRDAVRRLESCESVWVLGARPWTLLPSYLWRMDVAIVPRVDNEWMQSVAAPLKVYESLAAGLPVVSTPIALPEHLRRFVLLAEGAQRFREAITEALAAPDAACERVEYAKLNCTWARRAEELGQLIAEQVHSPAEGAVSRG